jgi:hypothetical protein
LLLMVVLMVDLLLLISLDSFLLVCSRLITVMLKKAHIHCTLIITGLLQSCMC